MRQLKINKSITNRESPSLDKYLQEIGREELISVDEEVELARRIREGDERAVDKLARANLRFVVSVAKQYQNQGLSLPDLINEGNLGLIKAARKSRFEQAHERRPSAEELAESMDVPVDKIADTLKVSSRHISMDAPLVDGEDNSLLDVLSNDDSPMADSSLNRESLSQEVERALRQLNEREREILRMFFGIGCREMSLEEIGERFDLTRERVRQIKEKAIRHLKGQKSRLLKAYLGQ